MYYVPPLPKITEALLSEQIGEEVPLLFRRSNSDSKWDVQKVLDPAMG
jgi:hypothetical protein